jgi:hypothetical protein
VRAGINSPQRCACDNTAADGCTDPLPSLRRQHPTLLDLPASVKLVSFDDVYEASATLQDVYPQARRCATRVNSFAHTQRDN